MKSVLTIINDPRRRRGNAVLPWLGSQRAATPRMVVGGAPAGGPPALAQKSGSVFTGEGNFSSWSSVTTSFGSATTTANLIVVIVDVYYIPGGVSVGDNKGNTYTQAVAQLSTPDGFYREVSIWYCANANGGSSHEIYASFSGGFGMIMGVTAAEFSGVAQSSPLDSVASGSFANAVWNYSLTPYPETTPACLVIGGIYGNISNSDGSVSGLTELYQNSGIRRWQTCYGVVDDTQAVAWSSSYQIYYGAAAAAAFKSS